MPPYTVAPSSPGQRGGVEGVVEVGVAQEDGVGPWRVLVQQGRVRRPHPAAQQVADGPASHVRVDEDRGALARDGEAGHAEPPDVHAGRKAELIRPDGEVGKHRLVGAVVPRPGCGIGEQVAQVDDGGGHLRQRTSRCRRKRPG